MNRTLRALSLAILVLLAACQTRDIDPAVERDAICSMLTCG